MYFIFNNMIYKHIDGASMKSPLGSSLAKAFSLAKAYLTYRKQNWINRGPLKYRPLHYQRYADNIFALFKSTDYLKRF